MTLTAWSMEGNMRLWSSTPPGVVSALLSLLQAPAASHFAIHRLVGLKGNVEDMLLPATVLLSNALPMIADQYYHAQTQVTASA